MRIPISFLSASILWVTTSLRADVTLAPLFTDHAVLQRDKRVPVWGRADVGEKITVTFGDQTARATTGADGRWIALLDAMPAKSEGADLVVAGKNTLTLHDIVVGEVWLCSGQSNMEWPVSRAANSAEEIAAANFPLIRHIKISHTVSEKPMETVKVGAGWQAATPDTVKNFTAVGYFFARDIFQKLNIPLGLVHSSWGGTIIEAWMSQAALASDPAFKVVTDRWEKDLAEYATKKAAYDAKFGDWRQAEAAAKAQGEVAHKTFLKQRPYERAPRGHGDSWTVSGLYNGMINPLVPYALRGALWYQGESNFDRASEYHALFAAMITAWRAHFGQGDLPFFWVSLANFKNDEDPTGLTYAFLREAQAQTLSLPNTGQALAIDIGDPDNIHPANKQEVGHRLALLAKHRVYQITADDTGPTFAGATREGAALRVRFSHVGSGLVAHDKPVQSLEIAGADRKFYPATGKIERGTLVASAPQVREPVAVRYAWRNSPEANLYGGSGLPAVPFRSDEW